MKKPICLFTLLILILSVFSQEEAWDRLTPIPTESSLKEIIKIPNTDRMLAVGSGATIIYTDDIGQNWNEQLKPADVSRFISFSAVHFVNNNIGYIVGSKSVILKTTDGGNTWDDISLPGDETILDVCFQSENEGLITLSNTVLITSDGGLTWDTAFADGGLAYPDHLHFVNDTMGFLASYHSQYFYRSSDSGNTWQKQDIVSPLGEFKVETVQFINADTGFLSGYTNLPGDNNFYVLKTINGAASWYIVNQSSTVGAHEIYFCNDTIGLIIGQEYYWDDFFRTTDGGETWQNIVPACGAIHLNSFIIDETGSGFCVGDRGFINKTIDWGATWECNSETLFSAGSINCKEMIDDSVILIGTTSYGGGVTSGKVIKSTDRGSAWENYFNTMGPVSDIQFLNMDTGFVCIDVFYGEIYRTRNNGNTWQTLVIDQFDFTTKCLHYINYSVGLVAGGDGPCRIFKTEDGGVTWDEKLDFSVGESILDMTFIDDSTGFAVGGWLGQYPALLKTNDQGDTWQSESLEYLALMNRIEFVNDSVGFITGWPGIVLKTIDYGNTWYETVVDIDGYIEFTDIWFPTEQIGYLSGTGYESTVFKSVDGGENWFPLEIPATSTMSCVAFFTENDGLILGNRGTVFHTKSGGIVDIYELPESNYDIQKLVCYPNPAFDVLNVKIPEDSEQSPYKIIISNPDGRIVHLSRQYKSEGTIQVDVSPFLRGLHIVTLFSEKNELIGVGKFLTE